MGCSACPVTAWGDAGLPLTPVQRRDRTVDSQTAVDPHLQSRRALRWDLIFKVLLVTYIANVYWKRSQTDTPNP